MNMNPRVLGALCLIGNAIWFVDSANWVASHGEWTTLHQITWTVAALGGIGGLLGLIALKATGTHPILRLIPYLPMLLLLVFVVGQIANFAPIGLVVAWFGQMAAMLVVGILALATKGWGWRKVTPLLTALAFPIAALTLGSLRSSGTSPMVQSFAWTLLGYAILSTAPAPAAAPAREAAA